MSAAGSFRLAVDVGNGFLDDGAHVATTMATVTGPPVVMQPFPQNS